MTPVDASAQSPKRAPQRHAADLSFHLQNALRSATALATSPQPHGKHGRARQVQEIVRRVRSEVRGWERELSQR